MQGTKDKFRFGMQGKTWMMAGFGDYYYHCTDLEIVEPGLPVSDRVESRCAECMHVA
jgi:hypothetical protein